MLSKGNSNNHCNYDLGPGFATLLGALSFRLYKVMPFHCPVILVRIVSKLQLRI